MISWDYLFTPASCKRIWAQWLVIHESLATLRCDRPRRQYIIPGRTSWNEPLCFLFSISLSKVKRLLRDFMIEATYQRLILNSLFQNFNYLLVQLFLQFVTCLGLYNYFTIVCLFGFQNFLRYLYFQLVGQIHRRGLLNISYNSCWSWFFGDHRFPGFNSEWSIGNRFPGFSFKREFLPWFIFGKALDIVFSQHELWSPHYFSSIQISCLLL